GDSCSKRSESPRSATANLQGLRTACPSAPSSYALASSANAPSKRDAASSCSASTSSPRTSEAAAPAPTASSRRSSVAAASSSSSFTDDPLVGVLCRCVGLVQPAGRAMSRAVLLQDRLFGAAAGERRRAARMEAAARRRAGRVGYLPGQEARQLPRAVVLRRGLDQGL